MSSEEITKNLDESIFNTSTLTTRTPPTANTTGMENLTKKAVVCNICNLTDLKLKVICHNCETTQHTACLSESDRDAIRTADWCCNKCTEALARSQKGSRGSERLKAREMHGSSSSLAAEKNTKALPISSLNVTQASTSSVKEVTTKAMTSMVTTTTTTTSSMVPLFSINKTSLLTNTMSDATLLGVSHMQPVSESTTRQSRGSHGGSSTSSSRRRTAEKLQALKEEHYFRQQRIAAEAEANAQRQEAETQRQEAAAQRKENEADKLAAKAKLLADEEEYQRKCREVIEEGSRRGSQASSTANSSVKQRSISDWVASQKSLPEVDVEEMQKTAEETRREQQRRQELVEEEHQRYIRTQVLLKTEKDRALLEARCQEDSRREETRRAETQRAEIQRVIMQREEEERRLAMQQAADARFKEFEERKRRERDIEMSRQELARWEMLAEQRREKECEKKRHEHERRLEETRREEILQRENRNKTAGADESTHRSRHHQDDLEKRREYERVQEELRREIQRDEEARNRTGDAGSSILRSRHHQEDLWSQLPWLSRNVTEDEFLETTLRGGSSQFRDSLLTKSQIQARHVIPKELPYFTGDPKLWPQFITTFAHSTHQCGFSAEENIARLSKSLKGDAYQAVRTDLLLPSSLPIVLNTLRRLYGRPHLILEAAEEELRQAPNVKLERFETIVMMALKVNSYCNTVKAAGMKEHLNNRVLLREVVQKLPAMFKLEWGRYRQNEEKSNPVITIEHFNDWLSSTADVAGCLADEPVGAFAATSSSRRTAKTSRNDAFHAAHELAVPADVKTDSRNTNCKTVDTNRSHCPFCSKSGHNPGQCRKFLAMHPKKRWMKVKATNVCVSCLGRHWIRDCQNKKICGIERCEQPHHPLLHSPPKNRDSSNETKESRESVAVKQIVKSSEPKAGTSGLQRSVLSHKQAREQKAYYQVVPVTLHGKEGRKIETYAFLDGGSTVTLLEEEVADLLGLVGVKEPLTLKWTNDVTREESDSRRVSCQISGKGLDEVYTMKNVRTAKKLALPRQAVTEEELLHYPHLEKINLATYTSVQPKILVGVDNHPLIVHQQVAEGKWLEPVAVRTRLGWALLGGDQTASSTQIGVNCHHEEDKQLHDLVKGFFSLESIGVKIPAQMVESHENRRSRDILNNVVRQLPEGRYEAGLLWRTDATSLPESRNMAMHRLLSFERKLQREPELSSAVNTQFNEYIAKKFLVKMTPEESRKHTDRTWYLPIFAVQNPNKPAKTRLVWDAAATVNGVSLNSELLTGPDMLANLVGVLLRFREHRYGVSADIKQMFHQIRIKQEDQDAQRCLWRDPVSKEVVTYKMAVMTFGAACSPSIAQYVKNLHADTFKEQYPRAVEAIHHRHYVDDYIDSFATAEECIDVTRQVTTIHKSGGFVLRGFVSNSTKVLNALSEDSGAGEKTLCNKDPSTTILGMRWRTTDDKFCFRVNEQRIGEDILRAEQNPSKREVLRLLMMIFDPLGILGFYILQGKLILKDVWRSGVNWHEKIQHNQMTKWREWVRSLQSIESVEVPRCYFGAEHIDSYEIHTFVDASEHAAAAVVYIIGINGNQRNVAFGMSKTKIAPNKTISIPRMELQAAVMGVRLAKTVKDQQSIFITRMTYWSDSQNVLCWLRSPREFKPFVAHRVGEILEATDVKQWRWVPTSQNVADEATKWKLSARYCVPARWFQGPAFLAGPSEEYPKERTNIAKPSEEVLEVRCMVIVSDKTNNMTPDFARFSSLRKLLRTQVYVMRYFYQRAKTMAISPKELEEARMYIIRSVQRAEFAEDWETIRTGQPVPKSSKLRKLSPFLDQNFILRMRSRLRDAEYLSYEQRCPIILPQKHPFTDLLIRQVHERYYHQYHGTVLNELQQEYRIPRLRGQLKKVRRECVRCHLRDVRPEVPEMADLPKSRLAARMRPFTYVGVDYFGPMTVKVGRRTEKRWGVIFTCLTIRAVHLELATSLSADSFLLMLRAFIARRGMPREISCDNGTNFRGAQTELRKLLKTNIADGVQAKYAEIKWQFNPPAAPHMGGAWERLIRSIKASLAHVLPVRNPSEELLRCCLVEIEGIVNSRPLTYVELRDDGLEALTPNHFLLGTSSGVKPFGKFGDDVHILRQEYKRQQEIMQKFWTRWVTEYLPSISARTRWYDPVAPIQIGDVVAVVNSEVPYSWQLGRIVETVKSKDGNVRQAVVKTASGILRRPASKLAVLIKEQTELTDRTCLSTGGSVADANALS